ncbi:16S rRNA (guanine(527)-N(7))-methyltransferase RsmG [Tessaracoccus sp. Z1128]
MSRDAIVALYPQSGEALSKYVDILASRGIEWGLLGPREGDKLWHRHIANSVALNDALPQGVDVADVGSGAGLPGLPIALTRPDLNVTLVEPLLRRANFLTLAVEELGVEARVRVSRSRAEETKDHFDVVVCRAVAPLERLLRWTTPLFAHGGQLLALKGESAELEIREAGKMLARWGLKAEVLELTVGPGTERARAIRVS